MPVFSYRAVDPSGEIVTGTLDCADERSAASQLQSTGHLPLAITTLGTSWLRAILDTEITPRDALGVADRVAFTRGLATLIGAGLPLDRALQTLHELGATRRIRAVSGKLHDGVRGGAPLSGALDEQSDGFPPLYRGIVRAGEAGARLDEALTDLADMLEESQRRAGDLRSALIYPAFLVITAIGSVSILLGYVVPTFEPLLAEAGVTPPLLTQAVIAAGRLVQDWWLAGLIALAVVVAIIVLALRLPEPRERWDLMRLRMPLLGPALMKFETARLARVLGTMLGNGVALPAALRLAADAVSNRAISSEIHRVLPDVEAGRGLAGPLREGALLPPLALQLIQVGQDSGDLTPMLRKLAEIFDVEAKRAFDQMLALLTPLLTLIMGAMIALIISSILYALFSINELAI